MATRSAVLAELTTHPRPYHYKALILGDVTTVTEAALLFNKGKSTIWYHIKEGHIETRRTLTGGDVFLSMRSLIKLWGEPEILLESLYTGKGHKTNGNGKSAAELDSASAASTER